MRRIPTCALVPNKLSKLEPSELLETDESNATDETEESSTTTLNDANKLSAVEMCKMVQVSRDRSKANEPNEVIARASLHCIEGGGDGNDGTKDGQRMQNAGGNETLVIPIPASDMQVTELPGATPTPIAMQQTTPLFAPSPSIPSATSTTPAIMQRTTPLFLASSSIPFTLPTPSPATPFAKPTPNLAIVSPQVFESNEDGWIQVATPPVSIVSIAPSIVSGNEQGNEQGSDDAPNAPLAVVSDTGIHQRDGPAFFAK